MSGSPHHSTEGPDRTALDTLAARYGVDTVRRDAAGRVERVPESTVIAVLAAFGVNASSPAEVNQALAGQSDRYEQRLLPPSIVVSIGQVPRLSLPAGARTEVIAESGETLPLGPGLPLGRHTVWARVDGRTASATLIVAPEGLPIPKTRAWGFMAQLYSLLSNRSWGMGDLADLADLTEWSGRALGAGFVQINPVHAAVPVSPVDPSPYRPSSRRFPDPVYLRIEDVPEFAYLDEPAAVQARELAGRAARLRRAVLGDAQGRIDRDAVWALKRRALELVHQVPLSPGRQAAYQYFIADMGQGLDEHATWCALAELYGPHWRAWPEALRNPRHAQVARARAEHYHLVDFHRWLTWLTDAQLAAAQDTALRSGMPVGIVHDLAIGAHPEGSDAWAWQHALAAGMSVGAPPDTFNPHGQDWGLPPWRPDRLADVGYAPYAELLRSQLRHAGGLRVDHVMGLFRLWWVPEGRSPAEGTYVRYDADAMLGVLTLEAHRAGALVLGEDLGTVEPGVRERLANRGVLGTSVLWFECEPATEGGEAVSHPLAPERWRSTCLAVATTHDLPSTASRFTGDHVELRHRLGLLGRPLDMERADQDAELNTWLAVFRRLGLLPEGKADEESMTKAVYGFLARTPARLVGVWLPDAMGDRRPQNVPGTWDQYPNWRLPLADAEQRPITLDRLASSSRLRALVHVVTSGFAAQPDGRS